MPRILLLRSSGSEAAAGPAESDAHGDVDVLVTHDVIANPDGIAEALALRPDGATLVVSSQTTVRVLCGAGHAAFFAAPFAAVRAVGGETAKALEARGARDVLVAAAPGAWGLLAELAPDLSGDRFVWPRGSDADLKPLGELARRGALVAAPVLYDKRPVAPDPGLVARFSAGAWSAVAVSSMAALDVLLGALAGRPVPKVRWGVIGPDSARHFAARGLPEPLVPKTAKISDLLEALRAAG